MFTTTHAYHSTEFKICRVGPVLPRTQRTRIRPLLSNASRKNYDEEQ